MCYFWYLEYNFLQWPYLLVPYVISNNRNVRIYYMCLKWEFGQSISVPSFNARDFLWIGSYYFQMFTWANVWRKYLASQKLHSFSLAKAACILLINAFHCTPIYFKLFIWCFFDWKQSALRMYLIDWSFDKLWIKTCGLSLLISLFVSITTFSTFIYMYL